MSGIPKIGMEAPDFTAAAFHDGAQVEVTLSGYRGLWMVILFYPGDFTCVCPTELASVAVKYPAIKELGAEVLGVSTDPVETHKEFQQKALCRMVPGGARFSLVADTGGEVGSLYGVYDPALKMHQRGRFIIDPEGILQSLEVVAAPLGRSMTEILRQLRALRLHRASGHLLPCGWEPGRPTLPATGENDEPTKPWETWKPRDAF